MAKKLTPKQRVTRLHTEASAKEWFDGWSSIEATKCSTVWLVHSHLGERIDMILGQGSTPNKAWMDAMKRVTQ